MNNKILKLVYTALMLAILISVQFLSKASGQIITGSCVNFILMFTEMMFGFFSSGIVAIVSPFMAFILGIGTPIIQIVPMIALGNLSYVLCANLLLKKNKINKIIIVAASSLIKFITLYVGVNYLILPSLGLPEAKLKALSLAFSWIQLLTALIGGILATIIKDRFKKIR